MTNQHKPDVMDILARYGRHDRDCVLHCESNLPGDARCTCGFSKAQVEAHQHDAKSRRNYGLEHGLEIIIAQSTLVATLPWEKSHPVNMAQTLDAIKTQARLSLNDHGRNVP